MSSRHIVVAAAFLALLAQLFVLAAGHALANNLIELLTAALATAACVHASRRAAGFARAFWLCMAWAFAIYTIGQAFYTWYDTIAHVPVTTWWPSDFLLACYMAPMVMVFFINIGDPGSRFFVWERRLDFLQVAIVALCAYIFFFYVPWQAHEQAESITLLAWRFENARNVLLASAFLGRAAVSRSRLDRSLFGRIGIFLVLFSFGYGLYVYVQNWGHMANATWYELLWTVPRLALIVMVASWDAPSPSGSVRRVGSARSLVLAQFAHIAFPLLVLAMARNALMDQLRIATVAVLASFGCSSVRLVLTHLGQSAALQRSRALQEKFATAFQSAPDSMTISALESGRYIEVNDRYLEFTGYQAHELIGRSSLELGLWADPQDRCRFVENLQAGGSVRNFQTTMRIKSGALRQVLLSGRVISSGAEAYVIVGVLDVSSRVLAEAQTVEWKERYDAAVFASGQVLFEWEPVSDETVFGGAIRAVLGYAPEEFQQRMRDWRSLIHPEDLSSYVEAMDRAIAQRQPFELEYRVRGADRAFHWLRERGQVIVPATGGPPRMIGFLADVTSQRELEQQFRQSQKMEAVGRLAGGVAHDFNNLLTVITGYSDLQLEATAADSALHKQAAEIHQAAQRAASLTQQLLAFSRQQVLQPRVLDLNEIVRGTERMLGRLIGEDVELRTALAHDLGMVEADRGQLEQVLMNLIINSRDAMPNGGKLTIDTANVHLDEQYSAAHPYVLPGAFIRLAVSDTGIGMDAATQARIFEPFFTTKDVGKGTGLGLSTVYGIVKQSRGHIEVYSELGKGTTFKIYIPRKFATASAAEMPARASRGGSEKVLLVEDDVQLRELARAILSAQGYTVTVAAGAEEVAPLCHVTAFHLIVTDVVMPRISGREVARQAATVLPAIKVLYMSGYTPDAVVHHGVLQEGIFFLQKPFSPATLAAKVREVLDSTPSAQTS